MTVSSIMNDDGTFVDILHPYDEDRFDTNDIPRQAVEPAPVLCLSLLCVISLSFSAIFASSHLKSPILLRKSPPTEQEQPRRNHHPPVIMISMDGFRHDFFSPSFPWNDTSKPNTPNLNSFLSSSSSIHVQSLHPIFPTKTFPNHYTIATGLYAESHGMIANEFYDPRRDKWFDYHNQSAVSDGYYWDEGEPIWATAEKQNKKSMIYFWPGSAASIRNVRPTWYYPTYDASLPFDQRMDQILKVLDLNCSNHDDDVTPMFDLIMIYLPEPDHTEHVYGPYSNVTSKAVEYVDGALGILFNGIKDRYPTADDMHHPNIILLSDHGMAQVPPNQIIYLEDYLDLHKVSIGLTSPLVQFWPDDDIDETYQNLTNITGFQIWKKDDIPSRFHYKNNPRIAPIVGLANEGWHVRQFWNETWTPGGEHGYDNTLDSMQAFMAVQGPAFTKNKRTVDGLNNTDVYNLICHLMGIEPAENNGTDYAIQELIGS